MPRKAWRVLATKTRVSDITRTFLERGERPSGHLPTFAMVEDLAQLRSVWESVGDQVLEDWLLTHPCTRPWAWWKVAAPEPRSRTGGIGTPLDQDLSIAQRYVYGLPSRWSSDPIVGFFCVGISVDKDDPPRFESQAAYLSRHQLLTDVERSYLLQHPELLDDETITP